MLSGSYDYGGRYLKAFSLDGDGTASLLLGKYRAGSTAELLTINASGELAAALPVEEQVLSLSARRAVCRRTHRRPAGYLQPGSGAL